MKIRRYNVSGTEIHIVILLILLVNIPIFKRIFKYIFPTKEEFIEALKYSFIPNLYSLFKGNYLKDWAAEMKIFFLWFSCMIIIVVEYILINAVINTLF